MSESNVSGSVTASDGMEVAVHDLGGAGGSPWLVMAHATGFHGRVFEPLAAELAGEFHCISFDERGHGDSGKPPEGDFDWRGFARDVLAVVDHLSPAPSVASPRDIPTRAGTLAERPIALGHSAGAAALLLAEQARPGTFSALYLWEPVMFPADPPLGRDPNNFLSVGARRRREEFPSLDDAFANFSSKPPFSSLDPAVLRAYVNHGFSANDGGVRLKCRRDHEALVYEFGSAHDAFVHLASVTCPTVIACGEKTDAFGPLLIEAFAERMPDARAEVLEGLGHFGPLEDPRAVAASLRKAFAGMPRIPRT